MNKLDELTIIRRFTNVLDVLAESEEDRECYSFYYTSAIKEARETAKLLRRLGLNLYFGKPACEWGRKIFPNGYELTIFMPRKN